MKVFQSAPLINSASKQMWGKDAPSVQDTSDLVTLGRKIINSDTDKEQFTGILFDRVKRTVIRTLDMSIDMKNIFMDENTYMGILQKINVAPIMASEDNSWNIGQDDYQTTIWEINKPNLSQTFFDNLSAFTIPVTIPDVLYKSAFLEGTMDAFITAIFSTIEMTLVMYINTLSHLAVTNLIAERIKAGKGVNLLKVFHDEGGSTDVTASNARRNQDFLKESGMIIRNYIKYMKNPSVLFNDGTELRATARDNMHVIMLSDFASSFATYLQSDTFHNELTALPFYDEIMFWQNTGNTTPNFAFNSSINIVPASEADKSTPTAVVQSGIVCLIADRQAVGVTVMEDWSGADRNNRERYTNYTFGANRGYFNDLSENAVVFYIADESA